MKKIEMINEIKNVVMNNGGSVNLRWITISVINGEVVRTLHGHSKNVKYETVEQIQVYLDCINDIKAETVETEVENNTENVSEPKATKKDIMMGLNDNRKVKFDLTTAEELETEGFIHIYRYEDGVLYGEVDYDAVCEDLIDEDDLDLFNEVRDGKFYHRDIDYVTDWYDFGYLSSIEYDCNGLWRCKVDWDGILAALCKRWDNKLNEAA